VVASQSEKPLPEYAFNKSDEKDFGLQELVKQKFNEWLQISTQSQITAYIKDLEQTILLKGSENLQRFFVSITEAAITKALDSA
jgi:hypothetical protein